MSEAMSEAMSETEVVETVLADPGFGSTLVEFVAGTFLTLLLSWFVALMAVLCADRLMEKAPPVKHLPPPTPAAFRAAWFWTLVSWFLVVLPLVLASAPLLRDPFPADAEFPHWVELFYGCMFALFLYEFIRLVDGKTLDLEGALRRWVRDVPKPLHGPLIWSGFFVHPADMVMQVVNGVCAPLVMSYFYEGLSLYLWWLWIALLQVLWILNRSNYAPPSPLDIMQDALMGEKKKKRIERKGVARDAARSMVREKLQKKGT